MNQKTIILAIVIIFAASFFRLAYIEKNEHNLDGQLFTYFNSPKDDSIDFSIENYTKNPETIWAIYCGENELKKQTIEIKNTQATISPDISCKKEQVKIEIKSGNNERVLYKNLNSM